MRERFMIWVMAFLCVFYGCSESEVVTTYEEVKETVEGPTPVIFSPYVGSSIEAEATTRADLNYLVYYLGLPTKGRYNNIPFEGQQANDSRRLGHLAYNNYIVGVYGFLHQGSDWEHSKATAKADFMTNQPLLHLYDKTNKKLIYEYSPLKYWPNNKTQSDWGEYTNQGYSTQTDKITFISYYPYQGYEDDVLYYRDDSGDNIETEARLGTNNSSVSIDKITYYGFVTSDDKTKKEKDLTCIEPPKSRDDENNLLSGPDAYTFGFQQKEKPKDHIDFMLGINKDMTKQSVSDKVVLNLRHALCCVIFGTEFYPTRSTSSTYLEEVPYEVVWEIKSISLCGVYDKGTVTPDWDDEHDSEKLTWVMDETREKVNYTVFEHGEGTDYPAGGVYDRNGNFYRCYPYYNAQFGDREGYDPSKPVSGNNKKYEIIGPKNAKEDATRAPSLYRDYDNDGSNLKGEYLKWLILALPQKANDDTYIDVVYDLKYTYKKDINGNVLDPPQTYIYKNCHEHLKVDNNFEFKAGTVVRFNLNFFLKSVTMSAEMLDWDYDDATDPDIYDNQNYTPDAPHEYDDYEKDYPVKVTDINFNSSTLHLAEGTTGFLPAFVVPSNATDKSVTWSSDEESVATVDETGIVTAVAEGTAHITATANDHSNGTIAKSYTVVVTPAVTGISLLETLDLDVGSTHTLTPTITADADAYTTVIWESSDESVATVDGTGIVTAVAKGTAIITAKTADGTNLSATCTVTTHPVTATDISLENPNNVNLSDLHVGDEFTLEATVTPPNATNKSVNWSSSDWSVAYVDGLGNVTAVGVGSATITATTDDGSNRSAFCTITVDPVLADGVTLNESSLELFVGEDCTLVATVIPDNATNKNVSWSSDNSSVAYVDGDGYVYAAGVGNATITATTDDGSNRSASCTVKVDPVPAERVTLNESSLNLFVGGDFTLVATVSPDNTTNKNVSWLSSNSSVASVDIDGNVYAAGVGNATITATTNDGSNISASCTVTVDPVAAQSVSLDEASLGLTVGGDHTLVATVYPLNATNKKVSWSSSESSVATVDANGKVYAVGVGNATITVTVDGTQITATCEVTVTAP